MGTRQSETVIWHCATPPPATHSHAGEVMTIGQLSQRTGMAIKTLRRYEGMGLVYTLGRSSSGYRLFDESALGCVRGIQSLRSLGLTETEIAKLASIHNDQPGQPIGPHLSRMLNAARTRITARIDALRQVRQRIDDFTTERPNALDPTPGGRPYGRDKAPVEDTEVHRWLPHDSPNPPTS